LAQELGGIALIKSPNVMIVIGHLGFRAEGIPAKDRCGSRAAKRGGKFGKRIAQKTEKHVARAKRN
jgi:hypothetical protein